MTTCRNCYTNRDCRQCPDRINMHTSLDIEQANEEGKIMKEEYIPYHRANLVAQLKRYAESAPKNLRNATIDQLKDEYSKYGITFYRSHSGKEKKYILELDLEHRLIVYSLDAARRISEKLNSIAKYVQESPDKDIGYPSYAHQEIIKQALSA